MNVPLEISFHQLEKTPAAEDLIRKRVAKLEQVCPNLSSCYVTVEPRRKREHPEYRVRVAATVPPSHELAAETNPKNVDLTDLGACIIDAFDAMERQVKSLRGKQQREVKRHEEQEIIGVIDRVFADDNYGFIRAADGGQVYFHTNALVNQKFEGIRPEWASTMTSKPEKRDRRRPACGSWTAVSVWGVAQASGPRGSAAKEKRRQWRALRRRARNPSTT